MKTARSLLTIAFIALALSGTAIAQNQPHATKQEIRDARLRGNCLAGLHSDNDGLIESVLLLVMRTKIQQPQLVLGSLSKVIDSLAVSGSTPSIRYKALLAARVCETPEWFTSCKNMNLQDRETSYRMIAGCMQEKLL
jgi:hypothetical protein